MKKRYKTAEIRRLFLDYFARHQHTVVASSSLIPTADPTLFFTNAGMVQFKKVFLGQEQRPYTRAVTVQRCLRASGKHNDLENVGYTTRHHTFFEMLGNFSFGDYFKQEAIHYAWEFLTKELGIAPHKLWITVHKDDQEAAQLWQEEFQRTQTQPQGLSYCDDKDNFWAMGDTGPCGYCSEIFYDHGEPLAGDPPGGTKEGERYVEIWNLVFMQFERNASGKLLPLPQPSIDTGMGLERIAAVMQGVYDNYATDIFVALQHKFIEALKTIGNITAATLNSAEAQLASRVVVDHIRAAVLLSADGVLPANEKSGYVLRSIIRRAIYYLYRIGVQQPLFFQLVYPVTAILGPVYPELSLDTMQQQITTLIEQEEIKFLATLDRGLKILEGEIAKLPGNTIPGSVAFNLHDTYGLPIILTTEIARKRGLILDHAGFEQEMEKQRGLSRAALKMEPPSTLKLPLTTETLFVGYHESSCTTQICGLFTQDGTPINTLHAGEAGLIVLTKTPFYAEAGGQVGDSGEIYTQAGVFIVQDTQKYSTLHVHYGTMLKGSLQLYEEVTAEIDATRRQMIRLNHSATHLLHRSLHLVVGEHAMQRGSLVNNNRLRFDFTHSAPLTAQELTEIEQLVNAKIRANLGVKTAIKSLAAAKQDGAMALFGEKYEDEVRVVAMDGFSTELCGGTHVQHTGEIGLFKIITEEGIAAGVRRIEAVTGEQALRRVNQVETALEHLSQLLGVSGEQLVDKIQQLIDDKRRQEKELHCLQHELMRNKNKELAQQASVINGVAILATSLKDIDNKILRQMVDALKHHLQSAVVVLAAVNGDKVQLIVGVTKDLLNRIKAHELLQYITKQLGGSGGGREDMAQGGGANVDSLQEILDSVLPWVKVKL